jgi:uncharacterized membrane protein YgcG
MKFGHTLLAAQWGPWEDLYIPYKALKKILKACTNGVVSCADAEGAFMTRLLKAVGSVDTFFASQVPVTPALTLTLTLAFSPTFTLALTLAFVASQVHNPSPGPAPTPPLALTLTPPLALALAPPVTLIPTQALTLFANQVLLLTERTAVLQRTAEPGGGGSGGGSGGCGAGGSGGCGAGGGGASGGGASGGGEDGEGGPEEAALSEEVELVCRGIEWLRHYAELNQVAR